MCKKEQEDPLGIKCISARHQALLTGLTYWSYCQLHTPHPTAIVVTAPRMAWCARSLLLKSPSAPTDPTNRPTSTQPPIPLPAPLSLANNPHLSHSPECLSPSCPACWQKSLVASSLTAPLSSTPTHKTQPYQAHSPTPTHPPTTPAHPPNTFTPAHPPTHHTHPQVPAPPSCPACSQR